MQESIDAILRLSKEDRSIQANRNNLEKIPAKRKKIRVKLARVEKKLSELTEKRDEIDQFIQEREMLIEVENEKVATTDQRMLAIKNQKEYYALQKEIDSAKRTAKKMEEQILALEERKAPLLQEIEVVQEEQSEELQAVQKKEKKINEEENSLRSKMDRYDALKEELMSAIGPELLEEYDKRINRNLVPAAVEINSSHCLGCAMAIPAQLFNDIIREQMGECPHCHRLLIYKKPEEVVEEEKPKKRSRAKKKTTS